MWGGSAASTPCAAALDTHPSPVRVTTDSARAQVLKEKVGGDAGLANACSAVDLHAEEMFKPDPELDAGLPSTAEWLASEGLSSVPL